VIEIGWAGFWVILRMCHLVKDGKIIHETFVVVGAVVVSNLNTSDVAIPTMS
jgi:hypothetical protein